MPKFLLFILSLFNEKCIKRFFINQTLRKIQFFNLLVSSSSRLSSMSKQYLKSRFPWRRMKNSPLEFQIFVFQNAKWKALILWLIGSFWVQFWVKLYVFFLIFHPILLDFVFDQYISLIFWKFINLSCFMNDFYLLILLLDFSMNGNPNRVIFYSVDFSWSLLYKHINFHNFSLQFIIKFWIYMSKILVIF